MNKDSVMIIYTRNLNVGIVDQTEGLDCKGFKSRVL